MSAHAIFCVHNAQLELSAEGGSLGGQFRDARGNTGVVAMERGSYR
jgi:hypothetical protein